MSEIEANYVRILIDHAEQRGRIPVLTETRTLGRVAGLKAVAPGRHVVLYRNLYQQWCSYTEQATSGNRYFLDTIPTIAGLSSHDPIIRDLLQIFPVEKPSDTDVNTFYLFVFLHVHLYAHAAAAANLVIDVNRLSSDKTYRTEIEETFRAQNVQVDFSEARPSTAFSLLHFPCRAHMLEQIRVLGDVIVAKAPSEGGGAFASKVIADLVDEFERHEFYSKRLRSVLFSIQRERDGALATAAERLAERDHARTDRGAVAAEVEEMRRQMAACQDDCERLRSERGSAVAAVETALGEADALRSAHDAALKTARGEADALQSTRDAALRDRAAIESEHRRLGEQLAALADVRDRLTAERDAALAARAQAEVERQRATEDYVALAHWSMAYHDSTARSLSWRLTRPLRWLGIGRPQRPPRPDLP